MQQLLRHASTYGNLTIICAMQTHVTQSNRLR
jgi:hypothetical protein